MTAYTDRYFDIDPHHREVARNLYHEIESLPLICPHGHVDPTLFSNPDYKFGTPTELLVIPDHYIFRMIYSQGISLESLGIPSENDVNVEKDHRAIWHRFAEHFYLFSGTPTGVWIRDELKNVFGINEPLNPDTADMIYDAIETQLRKPEFSPRALFDRFGIEVLCTTDSATDSLESHQAIKDSDWQGDIRPTFRPDAAIDLSNENWLDEINRLGELVGTKITSYRQFITALENRRTFFKEMGAKATDHAALSAYTGRLSDTTAEQIFQRALKGMLEKDDPIIFTGHMLIEMARMSSEDGLVMQLHVGSLRNHNPTIFSTFGRDKGADIPITAEFTRNLKPLLDLYGNNPTLRIILFCLDETNYSRELAPLAGHYPTLLLGPPWWFHDSLNGISRFFDQVMETAGIYNTAGFNDDTRAFPSIPARHDLWRRASANWLAGLVVRHIIDMNDARNMSYELAVGLAKRAYKLG